jgi:hypothetical protein
MFMQVILPMLREYEPNITIWLSPTDIVLPGEIAERINNRLLSLEQPLLFYFGK